MLKVLKNHKLYWLGALLLAGIGYQIFDGFRSANHCNASYNALNYNIWRIVFYATLILAFTTMWQAYSPKNRWVHIFISFLVAGVTAVVTYLIVAIIVVHRGGLGVF